MKDIIKFGINSSKNHLLHNIDSMLNFSISKPTLVNIVFTRSCNFRCNQCSCWKKPKDYQELTLEQWKKILLKLKKWIGPFYLNVSGGEPFIRKEVIDLFKFTSQNGIITDVITNGSLIDKKMAKKIADSGLHKITFSLDGDNPETHNASRNFKKSFELTLNAIKELISIKPNMNISINTILMDQNMNEMEGLLLLAKKYNLNGVYFRGLLCEIFKAGSSKENNYWPKDYENTCKSIDNIIHLKKEGYPVTNSVKHLTLLKEYFKTPSKKFKELSCLRRRTSIYIDTTGDVYSCTSFGAQKKIGNLLTDNPKEIWNSKTTLKLRNNSKNCKEPCILQNPGDLKDSITNKYNIFYRSFKKMLNHSKKGL